MDIDFDSMTPNQVRELTKKEDLITFPLEIVGDCTNSLSIQDAAGFEVCQIYREGDIALKDWLLAHWIVDALYERGG